MKKIVFLTLALASLALANSCSTKQEAPKSAANVQQAADAPASGDDIFKYTITTDISNSSEDDEIKILVAMNSVNGQYPVKYDLDCEGDGEFEYKGLTDNQKCIYKENSGNHQIWVRGEIPAMFLCARSLEVNCGPEVPEEDKHPLCDAPEEGDHSTKAVISIDSWGNVPWKSMHLFAAECEALDKLPQDSPDLSQVKDTSGMFYGATSFNQPLEKWNMSNVNDMGGMFAGAESFNQPLDAWDVSHVKSIAGMLCGAISYRQILDNWNVSALESSDNMFAGAVSMTSLPKWRNHHGV